MNCYLYQHITVSTWIREGLNVNTLDFVYTNAEHITENLQIEPPREMSDHVGLFLEFLCYTS